MSDGTYEEKLACGGTLHVTKGGWEISYYFPGPDLRYTGTFFSVPGDKVSEYIQAFEENWNEMQELKNSIPKGGEFIKQARMGMNIRISDFACGVCIHYHYMPINSEARLHEITSAYRYAMKRAPQIQEFLKSI